MNLCGVARILNQPPRRINARVYGRAPAADEFQTNVIFTRGVAATIGLSGRGPVRIAQTTNRGNRSQRMMTSPGRRLPVGAEVRAEGGVHFRVWAPRRRRVEVVLETEGARAAAELQREDGGYFCAHVRAAGAGTLYRFRLDGEDRLYPDPASRFQPEGPHGPSRVVDPSKFNWTDAEWKGARLKGQVVYEMHVGTFTREGTWAAAARELKELADVGVTCVEMMPVAEFPGRFGWGYDGVDLFAP